MARDSGGTYTRPVGQPVVSGTTITSATFNTLTADLATEITDSLDRSGKGGMLAALRGTDGSVAAPAFSFTNESGSGLYRIGASDIAVAVAGAKVLELTASAATIVQALTCSAAATITGALTCNAGVSATGGGISLTVGTANTSATVVGNRSAADSGADVVANSVAIRTAGNLFQIQNNTTAKLSVDFAGQIKWPSGPASTATTPAASALTVPTPTTNWNATNGLAYWKDAFGMVHIKGSVASVNAGGGTTAFTLPAGFRPANDRVFYYSASNVTQLISIIASTGAVNPSLITSGTTTWLDGVHFLAEQ